MNGKIKPNSRNEGIYMKLSGKKVIGISLAAAVFVLSTPDRALAVPASGADAAAAGAAVVLDNYYQESRTKASKAVTDADVVATAPDIALTQIPGYANLGIANVTDSLNIRKVPVDGEIVGRLLKDGACDIISEENGWYYIKSGEIEGYVSAEFILTGQPALKKANEVMVNVATVNADALFLREEPNTNSGIKEVLGNSEKLEVLETSNNWAKVLVDSTEGYVSMDYITIAPELQTARTMAQLRYGMEVSDLRIQIANFAQQFVGYPYVYGGNSLTKGTDCSGFTNLIYANFGISIPRTATTQYNFGTKISIDELKPGDLIIYGESSIEHVGMYIGNGQIVHASNERTGIKYSQMYYRNIIGCVRIIND